MTYKVAAVLAGFILSLLSPVGNLYSQTEGNKGESGKIRIASCQFPVSEDIGENYHWIEKQIIEAHLKKADVVHFPECALSGYAGSDMKSLDDFDWDALHNYTDSVMYPGP